MHKQFWQIAKWAGCVCLTIFTAVDAYIWIGPALPERLESAFVCGGVAGGLWIFAAELFEHVMDL